MAHNRTFIRLPQVLQMVGLSRREVYRRMANGSFPRSVPLGEKIVAWVLDEVDDWINAQIANRDTKTNQSQESQ